MTDKAQIALRYWLLGKGWSVASNAMSYAAGFHTGVRKDGVTPEFSHQIAIAHYLRTMEPLLDWPEETLAVAFLHDLREDYGVGDEDIADKFGVGVAEAVDAMTKEYGNVRRNDEAVYQRIACDALASVVKGADRIHNQHTAAGVFTVEKIRAYIAETRGFVLPMLKEARRRYPSQEAVYENLKFVLESQVGLLEAALS